VGSGRYETTIDPTWWITVGPNGGYLAAIMLRAVIAELSDPERRPRSVTIHFLRRPEAGPAGVDVTVERTGRSMSTVSVRLTQGGVTMALGVVAAGVDRTNSVSFNDDHGLPLLSSGGKVPLPENVPSIPVDPERDIPMRSHYDMRWVVGDLPFAPSGGGDQSAMCGGWIRLADGDAIDELVLLAMSDAWLPPIFSRVSELVGVPTVDLTVHFRARPVLLLDHCFVEFSSPVAADGYLVEHGRILDRDGRLLVESRQLAAVL